jgi:hypothetical protein
MKSPFPGMDPYLEGHWRDVHQRLITYICDALQPGLPSDLVIRAEERVFVRSPRAAQAYRDVYPDVRVVEIDSLPIRFAPPVAAAMSVAVAEPVVVRLQSEPMTEAYLEVRELPTERVVTTIDVLSPTNKRPGDGARQYRQKQQELELAGIGLVEVDLLRGGQWVVRTPRVRLRPELQTPYRVCVTNGWDPDETLYYPIALAARLPNVKVPLREADEAAVLELQPLLDQAYRNGRYAAMDYTVDADPPLAGDDAKWADELLRTAGRR